MTKHVICILALICTVSCAVAQTTSGQSSPTYQGNNNDNNQPGQYGRSERAPRNNPQAPAYNANQTQIEAGGVLFSNRLGQTFSAQDLAAQLQNLRNAVDQTVPILSAFNETYSNSNSGGHQTVGSALSGIVSDVFHRNQGSAQASANESPTTSNLLSVLHGLLNKNSTATTTPAAAPNPQDLLSLQSDLQPVVSVLQRLNVQSTSNQLAAPYPNGSLTPTGR